MVREFGEIPPVDERFIEYRLLEFPLRRAAAWETALAAAQPYQDGDIKTANRMWRMAVQEDPGLVFTARPDHMVGESELRSLIRANLEYQPTSVGGMRRFISEMLGSNVMVITPYSGDSNEWEEEEREIDRELAEGRFTTFPSVGEAILYLMQEAGI